MASLQCSEDWRTFHKQSGSFLLFHEAEEVIHLHPKQIISNKEFIVKPSKVLCSWIMFIIWQSWLLEKPNYDIINSKGIFSTGNTFLMFKLSGSVLNKLILNLWKKNWPRETEICCLLWYMSHTASVVEPCRPFPGPLHYPLVFVLLLWDFPLI